MLLSAAEPQKSPLNVLILLQLESCGFCRFTQVLPNAAGLAKCLAAKEEDGFKLFGFVLLFVNPLPATHAIPLLLLSLFVCVLL